MPQLRGLNSHKPAGRLAGGRQDARQGGAALPEEKKAQQDRAQAQGLNSKVGGRQCVAGLRQRLLDRLAPLVMSPLVALGRPW